MQHRLVILGSMGEFTDLAALARERGYYTIVCDKYPDGPAKKHADKAYNVDVRSAEQVAEICRKEKADGIITSFSDVLFEQATIIADMAGLKWYAKPDMLKYYREKNHTKQLLRSLGIRVPRSVTLKPDFSDRELDGLQYPLVIKPVNGYGSKGIFVVSSLAELRSRYSQVLERSPMGGMIQVEEYSRGYEYNMMAWMTDGQVHVLSLADREKNPRQGDQVPMLNREVYPAMGYDRILPEATAILEKFAAAVGQKNGALSMQFFYSDQGIEVCEIAGRMFAYIHEMLTLAGGLNIEELLLDYVYDEKRVAEVLENYDSGFDQFYSSFYVYGIQGKKIRDLSDLYRVGSDPHVIDAVVFYRDGEEIDNYGPNPYLARYYLKADTREELDRTMDGIFSTIHVLAEDGEEAVKRPVLEHRTV